MKTFMTTVLVAGALFAAEGYHVMNKIKIGGTGGWDYVSVDSNARRLYATHATSVEVVDLDAGKVVGSIPQLHGVHGVAVVPELNKGFITNGQSNSVTIFDLKTLAKTGEPATGMNPDSVCYEPKTQRVFTFNGRSNDSTVINAKTGEPQNTFPVGGKPEFCVADGTGKLYVNLEDRSSIVEIDAAKPAVLRTASLAPCEEPSGLALDSKDGVLFSVCSNKVMAVTDIKSLKVIATPTIGAGPDAAAFDAGAGLAFSSNADSTLTIVKNTGGKWEAVDTVQTEPRARTMTVDPKTHRVYLLAAEFGPAPAGKGEKKGRPPVLPDTFHVLVVGK
ncbi:MAG: YVTN family beta-propeller domain-containing protein [Terriglobia bacterium]|nr:MAG: YVTN family beta-propeller domain-containing protein [Terriglobia bacterium]